jgi:hypothetical protein
MDSTTNPKGENNGRIRGWGMLLGSQHFGVEGRARALGWGLGRMTSNSITHTNLYKLNNKLVSA